MKKSFLTYIVTTLALALLLAKHVSAQNVPVRDESEREFIYEDTIQLDEIIITGTKTSVNRNSVPMTISVVTEKQIEQSSESALLPVLSEMVPGIFITERGITGFGVATGSAGAISIRGLGGSPNTQTLILLNGNPQFMGIMGHPLPDAYVASDVEKVEIIRGPASTLYGSNAMGGVINIITREQTKEGFEANARLMYGSYNTQKYMINAGYKKRGFEAFSSFNHDQTNGHRDSSDFAINNGYIRLGYVISPKFNIKVDFSLAEFNATDPGQEEAIAGETIDITRGMGSVSISSQFERSSGSARFFYNFGEHNITDGFHSKDNNYGLIVYQSAKLFKGNTITLGFDYKQYGGIAENIKALEGQGMVFGDTIVLEVAGYGYIQQVLFDRLTINAGFRLEHSSVYGNEPVPTSGLSFHLTPTTTIKASTAKGFRSPTIRELYLWGTANPDLKPERMVNYEISLMQQLWQGKLALELTGFKAEGNNLIKAVTGSGGTKYENTGAFSNLGLEFAGSFKPVNNLSFLVNYSYISLDEPIIATPRQQVNLNGNYLWRNLQFNLSLQYVDDLYTRVMPVEEKESYMLINTRIAYAISKYVDIFLKGENLTDKVYYINYGYPMPGFVAFGGINLHY